AGKLAGDYTAWHPNGYLDTKGQYSLVENEPDTLQQEMVSDDYWNHQQAAEIVPSKEQGVKVGRWEYYHDTGQLSTVEEYDSQGYLNAAEYWNADGSSATIPALQDHPAQFPGGQMGLMK